MGYISDAYLADPYSVPPCHHDGASDLQRPLRSCFRQWLTPGALQYAGLVGRGAHLSMRRGLFLTTGIAIFENMVLAVPHLQPPNQALFPA